MAFRSNLVTVAATATAVVAPGQDGLLVQNLSAVDITLGGPGVVAGQGLKLPASSTTPVLTRTPHQPEGESGDENLYAIVATGTANLAYLLTS